MYFYERLKVDECFLEDKVSMIGEISRLGDGNQTKKSHPEIPLSLLFS